MTKITEDQILELIELLEDKDAANSAYWLSNIIQDDGTINVRRCVMSVVTQEERKKLEKENV